MRDTESEQAIVDFYAYPSIGGDDWRYTFAAAQVRALETQMLSGATGLDMANAQSFQQAADLLSGTEYALPQAGKNFGEVESLLRQRRSGVRLLFEGLCVDKAFVRLFKSRDDFANLRLAVRRTVTEQAIGADYSDEGNVGPERFQQVFEEQNQSGGSGFPDYMHEVADRAVLAYYQNKDIRRIDYAIDGYQAEYNLREAGRLKNLFLLGLFRIQVDLTNIRTMLRLRITEAEQRNVFLEGGYIEHERLQRGVELGYEALGGLFFATPYYRVVEAGAAYLASNRSFLKLEQQCEEYLTGFLKRTAQITAGPQPVIAYLLMKETEIRTVRFILTAKKNHLDTKLILDRIS
ncbi:MAG: V-type ATPase subunit [Planctomycetota bacterium]|jgi:V/A-type H+-transporting ATPase subunit C